jgi:negative regulator of replication initiation
MKKLPQKWQSEQKAIRAIQLAFDLDEKIQSVIREEAQSTGVSASEHIRGILGLSVTGKPVRPRLTVSLKPEDFEQLAQKYQVDASNRKEIKDCVSRDLQDYVNLKLQK